MIESSSKTKDKGTSKVVAISGIGILVGLMVVASVGIMMSFTAPSVDAEPVAQTTFDEHEDRVDVTIDTPVRIDSASVHVKYGDEFSEVRDIDTIQSVNTVDVPLDSHSEDPTKITVYGTNGSNTEILKTYTVQNRDTVSEAEESASNTVQIES